ncbi:MAG TPA: hypothetical protein DEP85_07190, partial [Holosporales bacterium]|nr:hypothetical protein [Holosporales bacterium]
DAIDALKEKYDLVLMDEKMPGELSGSQAAQKIRDSNKNLPIIRVSGDDTNPVGMAWNGFLTKPLKKEALYAEIQKCLMNLNNNTASSSSSHSGNDVTEHK